jgi:hypothetical protein
MELVAGESLQAQMVRATVDREAVRFAREILGSRAARARSCTGT